MKLCYKYDIIPFTYYLYTNLIINMASQTSRHQYTYFPSGFSFDALILDAHTNQSLVALHSLGRKGLRVAMLSSVGTPVPAFSSHWCALALIAPANESTDMYARFLLDFLKKNKVKV